MFRIPLRPRSMYQTRAVPAPESCCACNSSLIRTNTTSAWNRKGNRNRPYYSCGDCDKFLGFADSNGNDANNPPCNCGIPSKMQIAGPEKPVSRGLHFVCSLATCKFYEPWTNEMGEQVRATDDGMAEVLARLGLRTGV
ncbi:hypothetical protein B0T16DRAFT_247042 [Cercophora newfieldiana]|uniref:GRF-like zinc ribbon domain-containing protein n=1 Tax=Cercophora newfieldiana TaxID=92897 RepID=A0AA40CIJ1_9PEZI|nr:hypothetical protein B0T16DRAFT_247042 [Cercophora newfieldiana]